MLRCLAQIELHHLVCSLEKSTHIGNDWSQKLPNIWQKHQWIYHWINKSEANYYKHNRTVLVFLLCSCNCVWHVSSLIVCCVIPMFTWMFEESDVYPNVWRGRCLPIISWMLFLCPVFRSPISTEIWDVFYSLNKEKNRTESYSDCLA